MNSTPRRRGPIPLIGFALLLSMGCGETNPDPATTPDVSDDVDSTQDLGPRLIDDRECWRHDECLQGLQCDPGAGTCSECFAPEHCLPGDTCWNGQCEPGGSCFLQKDCPDGMICATGSCVECKKDSQCPEPLECIQNTCRGPEVACALQADCAIHGGTCGESFTCVDCSDDADCSLETHCLNQLCAPDTCSPGSAYCDGEHRVLCSPNGSGLEATSCPESTRCTEGECIPTEGG